MLRTTGFAIPLLLLAAPAQAASSDTQFWVMASTSFKPAKDLVATIDVSPRARSTTAGNDQLLTRASLDYTIHKGVSIGAGVAWVESGGPTEVRPHQQITLTSGPLSLRSRLEERIIDGAPQTGLRLRERVLGKLELDRNDQLTASAELFLTLRPTAVGKPTGVEQVRFNLTELHRVAHNLDLGLAYLLIVTNRAGKPDQISHVPQLVISWRL